MALPPDQFPGAGGSSMFGSRFCFLETMSCLYFCAILLTNLYSRLASGSRQCSAYSSRVRKLFHLFIIASKSWTLSSICHVRKFSLLHYILDTTSQSQGHWQATVRELQGLRAPSQDETWEKLYRLGIKCRTSQKSAWVVQTLYTNLYLISYTFVFHGY